MNLAPNGLPVAFQTRSWLVIPPLEEAALAASARSGADIVVFDLDAIGAVRRMVAAETLVSFLSAPDSGFGGPNAPACFFLLPEMDEMTDPLLEILVPARPQGIVFRSADSRDIQEMDVLLAVHEALNDMEDGITRLACLQAHAFGMEPAGLSRRLIAIGWDAEAFRAHLGATRMFDQDGHLTDSFRQARCSVLHAAASAGIEAIDGASGLLSSERLKRDVAEAAADGFTGKFSLAPRQVAAINHGFTPSAMEIAEARAFVETGDDRDTRRHLRATRVLQRSMPSAEAPDQGVFGRNSSKTSPPSQ